jgi:hypothetical protein
LKYFESSHGSKFGSVYESTVRKHIVCKRTCPLHASEWFDEPIFVASMTGYLPATPPTEAF